MEHEIYIENHTLYSIAVFTSENGTQSLLCVIWTCGSVSPLKHWLCVWLAVHSEFLVLLLSLHCHQQEAIIILLYLEPKKCYVCGPSVGV